MVTCNQGPVLGLALTLFHYKSNVSVDITTSVDPATKTNCGATTTLSAFCRSRVASSVRTWFQSPVNPIAGFLNTVKGGAAVLLKFNVDDDGDPTDVDG
jgi:hypothetical protein